MNKFVTWVRRIVDQSARRCIAQLVWECEVSTERNCGGARGWEVTMHIPDREVAALNKLPAEYVENFIRRVATEMVERAVYGVMDRPNQGKSVLHEISPAIMSVLLDPLSIGPRCRSGAKRQYLSARSIGYGNLQLVENKSKPMVGSANESVRRQFDKLLVTVGSFGILFSGHL